MKGKSQPLGQGARALAQFPILGGVLTVDGFAGPDHSLAQVSLRDCTRSSHGKVLQSGLADRSTILQMSLTLLEIADQMLPITLGGDEVNVADMRREVTSRVERLKDRATTLLLARRVLERCDKEVADTIASLLLHAEQTGDLPVRFGLSQIPKAAHDAMAALSQGMDPGTTKH